MSQSFHFPTLEYLEFGNIFSSSLDNFNFKIFPDVDYCKIKTIIWQGKNCLAASEALLEKSFNLSDDGFQEMINWVKYNYEKLKG